MNIGVLALQGNFDDQIRILSHFAPTVKPVEIRYAHQLSTLHALILPGGESTTIGILLEKHGLLQPLQAFIQSGKPVWGVCAGAILLANRVKNLQALGLDHHKQPVIGGLDITLVRNYFGSQRYSSLQTMVVQDESLQKEQFFIRAPGIVETGKTVEILSTLKDGVICAVRQGNVLATVFHSELEGDVSWHQYFLGMVTKIDQVKINNTYLQNPSWRVKTAFPRFLKGGVIMDVVNAQQAQVAEAAGACCVMALERIPADIKKDGGIARMSDPALIKSIQETVSIPVMAKARIGHFGEARILEALDVDCIDESEVLTAADKVHHIHKHPFEIPFVCGARNLGEALRRISEGAAMIRIKGDAGTGNVVNAVEHCRALFGEIRRLKGLAEEELFLFSKEHQVPIELVQETRRLGRLPVVTFAAGGIATPADVMLTMMLGCDGVFVGSGIFKSSDPEVRAKAMVDACTYYQDAKMVAKVSENLGKPMVGILQPGEQYSFVNPKL